MVIPSGARTTTGKNCYGHYEDPHHVDDAMRMIPVLMLVTYTVAFGTIPVMNGATRGIGPTPTCSPALTSRRLHWPTRA